MALKDFRISDADASQHAWDSVEGGRRQCMRCGALVEIHNDMHLQVYPAWRAPDCAQQPAHIASADSSVKPRRKNTEASCPRAKAKSNACKDFRVARFKYGRAQLSRCCRIPRHSHYFFRSCRPYVRRCGGTSPVQRTRVVRMLAFVF